MSFSGIPYPSNPAEVAGQHLAHYEALYAEADPSQQGFVSAQQAAAFLKRSNLDNGTLGKVWELSDRNRQGRLDKLGLFVALKMIAALQHDSTRPPSLDAIANHMLPPPNIQGRATSPSIPMFGSQYEWGISDDDQQKYQKIFHSLGPLEGKLSGDKVKPVLMNSGLPANMLGKIWDLSDIDKDGFLDEDEMCVALYLVYRALENDPIPNALPNSIVPPSKRGRVVGRRTSMPPAPNAVSVLPPINPGGAPTPPPSGRGRASSMTAVDGLDESDGGFGTPRSAARAQQSSATAAVPIATGAVRSLTTTPIPMGSSPLIGSLSATPIANDAVPWAVDVAKWQNGFLAADTDHDGLVSGGDIKGVLMGSGLAQNYLAHIWTLVDIQKNGVLNLEQFALAMHLIERKRTLGEDPPSVLPIDLMPPALRPKPAGMTDISTSTRQDSPALGQSTTGSSGNVEIDNLNGEIELQQRERRETDSSIVQVEADMTVKQSEIKNLEIELNTLATTVLQLERQKSEATRRLNDLDSQRDALEKTLAEFQGKLGHEELEVATLTADVESAATNQSSQEQELNAKRSELQQLRDEESHLQVTLQNEKANLDTVNQNYGAVEREIQQTEAYSSRLSQQTAAVQQSLGRLEEIVASGNVDALLNAERALLDAVETLSIADIATTPVGGGGRPTFTPTQSPKKVATSAATASSVTNGVEATAPAHLARLYDDPFQESDPFSGGAAAEDPFAAKSGVADPFQSSDPFAPTAEINGPAGDPFASGGGGSPTKAAAGGPPPRPTAPPKGRATPTANVAAPAVDPFAASPADPWGEASGSAATPVGGGGGFADFANFS